MNVVLQVLSYLGGIAAVVAVVTFLSKHWVLQRLARDLESHKAQLRFEHERQVQNLRRDFEREAREHQIKFQQVFPQRHQGLIEIHRIVRDVVDVCALALRSDGDPHVPAAIAATEAMQKAVYAYEIYIPRALCDKWRKTAGKMFAALIELQHARAQRTHNWAEDRKALASAVDGYVDTLKEMSEEVADDIRGIIGVEPPEKKES